MDLKDGRMKKMIFNGLEASCFPKHFALTITGFWDIVYSLQLLLIGLQRAILPFGIFTI
jgi:hypothetical protein